MIKLKNRFALLLILLMAFGVFASGCSLIEKSPEAIAKQNVAKVGDEYITRGELDKEFSPILEQIKAQYGENYLTSDEGKQLILDQKKYLLEILVDNKIFAQKAKEFNLFKDENEINEEVEKYISDMLKMYGMTEEQFTEQLKQSNTTREDFVRMVKEQAVIPSKVYEYMVKDVTVGDDEIQKYYDENKETLTEKPNTMEVSHILLDTEEAAKEVKAELEKGADFATLAKEKSIEPAAKETGGNLGEILYNDPNYDETFVKAAMGLKEGEISDPVATQSGFHIIKVTKKTEYPILTLEQAKEQIENQLSNEKKQAKYSETMAEWKEKAAVKLYEKNINN